MMEIFSHQRENIDLVKALSDFCMRPTGRELCRSVVYVVFGPSNFYFDELLRTIQNHIPAGASYRQFIHYAQIAAARKFSKILSKKRIISNPINVIAIEFILIRKIPKISSWNWDEYENLWNTRAATIRLIQSSYQYSSTTWDKWLVDAIISEYRFETFW